MTIRWKLALTLALPLVALAFVVGRGVLEERRTVAENEDARDLIQLALLGRDVMGRAQLEHGLQLAGGFPGAIRDLRDRRREAVRAFQEALASDVRWRFGSTFETKVADVEQAIRAFEAAERSSAGEAGDPATVSGLGRSVVDLTYFGAQSIDHDGELAQRLLGYAALLEAEQKLGELFGVVAALPDGASLSGDLRLRLASDRGRLDTAVGAFTATADPADRAAVEQAMPADALASLTSAASPDREAFTAAASRGIEALDALSASVAGELDALAASKRDAASREALEFLALGGGATIVGLVALLLALRFSSRLVGRLRRLSKAAEELSERRLPALVEGLRSGRTGVAEEAKVELGDLGRDEIGVLGRSFETVHGTVLEVAREQGRILEQGISDIFVKLARRNQALVERQIALLDQLERDEEDPDVLADLFRIDHIATRIRRNAESLLVLAGSESTRKWTRPLPLADVVQAATAEIEDYDRIRLVHVDDAQIRAQAAVDLAHLLAELLENAVRFSPPDSVVEVACRTRGSSCQVVIADHGVGMTDGQLDEANALLANPPVAGLDLSRTLGHYVVARLARRHGMEVRLAPGTLDGVVALVSLPVGVLQEAEPEPPTSTTVEGAPPASEATHSTSGNGELPQRLLPQPADVSAEPARAANGGAAAAPPAPQPVVEPAGEAPPPAASFEPLPARLRPPDPIVPAEGESAPELPRRGATVIFTVPPGPGAGVAASSRTPQERRDLISRFRRGFTSGRQRSAEPSDNGEKVDG